MKRFILGALGYMLGWWVLAGVTICFEWVSDRLRERRRLRDAFRIVEPRPYRDPFR
jgi:hypothetical protein